MARRRRHKGIRNRPSSSRRGPGPTERKMRGLTMPSDQRPNKGTTIYESADKPRELKDDAELTLEVRDIKDPPSELRQRGLPYWLASKFYKRTSELMDNPELTETGQKQLAQAVNMIAKVDVETARFQLGEAATTQVQVNQVQTSPVDLMKAYLNEVQDRIAAAYPPPPPAIEVESSPVPEAPQFPDADEIAEAIKAEVPALKNMNGALSKIVTEVIAKAGKKVMDQKKQNPDQPPPAS